MTQEWLHRVGSEIRVHGHGIGVVANECLTCVVFGGRADITALGIEDQYMIRVGIADVCADPLELRLGTLRCEVCDLRFERARR